MKKKQKRLIRVLAVLAAVALLAAFVPNLIVCVTTADKILPLDRVRSYDCILILGAGLRADGSPSLMLTERLDCGYELYMAKKAPKILVSGDHGTDEYDEVNAMKRYLIDRGVPSEDIFMDHAGFSTYDSLFRAKAVFACSSVCVVTQKYHLYRALYTARCVGLDAVGVDAKRHEYRGQRMRDLREIAARTKDFYKALLLPDPRFLGDTLPIDGNGDITNDKLP